MPQQTIKQFNAITYKAMLGVKRSKSDQLLNLMEFENKSPYGVLISENERITESNFIIEDLLGYSKSELIHKEINEICFATNIQKFKNSLKLLEQGSLDDFEVIKGFYKKAGEIMWAKTKIYAIRNDNREMVGQMAIIENLTQIYSGNLGIDTVNTIAKSILGKEDIYEIAWEISLNIATYLDTNDCVIYLADDKSMNLEQIAAYTNKLEGDKNILNKISIPIGQGIVGTVAETGKAEIVNDTSKDERYIVDDDFRYSEITVPILSEGKIIGVIDAEHERKNYFNQDHVRTLESIANLVSLQLKSAINLRKLKDAQQRNTELLKKLEKRNSELHEYAHVVSHDLKSPLRSISALATWIKLDNYDVLNETSHQYFEDLEKTLETMENLISNILEYSSIENSPDVHEHVVDLNVVLVDLIKVLYKPQNISIQILNQLPVVKGDPIKFQQLFQNLLSNSIKFNDKRDGLITIDVKERPSFYEFSIEDNGIGIEEKYFTKIFKIFQSLKKDKDSSGVGLSIVKKIVDLYQGEIWLESKVNQGTTFYFTIRK